MDVLVCGAQSPFALGGAELLMDNLVGALRSAGHHADLVRIPVAWDQERVFDAALAWRLVPADADLVIATNFPSYFVQHPRKVVWLLHQHRGAYDAVDAPWSDIGTDPVSLETQRLLAQWDATALGEAERVFTLSQVVTDRLGRFNGIGSTPLYHPPPLHQELHEGPFGDYVFCPSRLEANKRPDLLVEAMSRTRTQVRAKLAGAGSMRAELAALSDSQGTTQVVELLGFVPDAELVSLYAGALAVVYPPHDEDYGYVTLQAFLSGKPVITTPDSGGVLEWVRHGENGLVTDGTPEGMAAAIDELAADPVRAASMGAAGRASVASLSWAPVVDALLGRP